MKKGKNLIAIFLCLAMCYIPMQAAGYYRTKNVQYGGINLYYNGMYQSAASEAVIIDGTTYLPVKSLGNLLGLSVNWNQNTQTISLGGSTSTLSTDVQIQAKDYEIATLRKELETLKNDGIVASTSSTTSSSITNVTSGTDITSSEVSATRRAVKSEYSDYFDDIDFDFALTLTSSKLKLTISIDDSSDYRAFKKLTKTQVRNFIEDVCEYIRDRHDNIAISGAIEYNNSDKTLYTFTYSKGDSLSYSNSSSSSSSSSSSESRLLSIIDDTRYVRIDGYSSSIAVEDASVSVSDSRERVTFNLYINVNDDIKTAWNNHTGTNNDTVLRSYLRSISNDLSDETDYDIQANIINKANGSTIAYYYYDGNEIHLYSI